MRVHTCVVAALVLAACEAPGQVYPAFDAHPPKSIRVILLDDRSGVPKASSSARDCCERTLVARGYTVAHVGDATLQLTIERCDRRLEASYGESGWVAAVSASLYDDGSGELLWSGKGSASTERDWEEREDFDLLGSVVDYALESTVSWSSDDDARDVIAEAVRYALESLPTAGSRGGTRQR